MLMRSNLNSLMSSSWAGNWTLWIRRHFWTPAGRLWTGFQSSLHQHPGKTLTNKKRNYLKWLIRLQPNCTGIKVQDTTSYELVMRSVDSSSFRVFHVGLEELKIKLLVVTRGTAFPLNQPQETPISTDECGM